MAMAPARKTLYSEAMKMTRRQYGAEGVFSAIVPEGEERRSERESGREVVGLECRARGPRVRESIAEPEDAASRRGVVEDRSLQSVLWRPLLVLRRWDADDDVE